MIAKEVYISHAHLQQSKAKTNAVSRSRTKRQVAVGYDIVLVLCRESFRVEALRFRPMLKVDGYK